jgi:hypothetical protein
MWSVVPTSKNGPRGPFWSNLDLIGSFSRTLWNQTSWLSLQVVAQVAFIHWYQLETQIFSIYCKYVLLCGCGYVWLKVCLSGHAHLVNFGSLSFLLISHFVLLVPRVKLMSHTIDMIFSALRGVNAWPQLYWFWSFYMGFWNYQKWHFMSHAEWRQRALKCYPWN